MIVLRINDKNINNVVLPPDPAYRPDLTAAVPHEDTYINAVLVPVRESFYLPQLLTARFFFPIKKVQERSSRAQDDIFNQY